MRPKQKAELLRRLHEMKLTNGQWKLLEHAVGMEEIRERHGVGGSVKAYDYKESTVFGLIDAGLLVASAAFKDSSAFVRATTLARLLVRLRRPKAALFARTWDELLTLYEEEKMNDPKEKKEKKPGPLVEDAGMTGGVDESTGESKIVPKTTEGTAPEGVDPTDERERKKKDD